MRLIDAEPIEQALFKQADKSLAKNPYANARVCAFRRAFELVMDAPTIESLPSGAPPNDPLTLEELREMDGEPVWVVTGSAINAGRGCWDICDWWDSNTVMFPYSGEQPRVGDYGITWMAYPPQAGGRGRYDGH